MVLAVSVDHPRHRPQVRLQCGRQRFARHCERGSGLPPAPHTTRRGCTNCTCRAIAAACRLLALNHDVFARAPGTPPGTGHIVCVAWPSNLACFQPVYLPTLAADHQAMPHPTARGLVSQCILLKLVPSLRRALALAVALALTLNVALGRVLALVLALDLALAATLLWPRKLRCVLRFARIPSRQPGWVRSHHTPWVIRSYRSLSQPDCRVMSLFAGKW